ncbi:hypothetical protein [Hanstruepera flava]|uniref:hypothetical protein n=1 Tax=Hanstruepera flava TaxID=2930218 RepID=UPI0020291DFE|nr:hypothetical protein [Hanstruepera flava]
MKLAIKHTTSILLFLTCTLSISQDKNVLGYKIDGDDIVFVFDTRDYEKATSDSSGSIKDFDDLKIEEVIVSGQFNNWTRDKWQMIKIGDNTFELRKKITDFSNESSWEFKFLINGKYWAEPTDKIANIVPAKTPNGKPLNVYNLKFYTAYQNEDGNACFKLYGYNNAKKVILAGSFNKWDENLFEMNKVGNGWEITLQIKPGSYEYRYIVDGKWIEDPYNPNKVGNEFGEYNSVINISKEVTFELQGFLDAKKVILSGSFNNWSENEPKMKKTDFGWTLTLTLAGGKHHYKFIIDNEWLIDPDNPVKEYDGKGNINSVCMVK